MKGGELEMVSKRCSIEKCVPQAFFLAESFIDLCAPVYRMSECLFECMCVYVCAWKNMAAAVLEHTPYIKCDNGRR